MATSNVGTSGGGVPSGMTSREAVEVVSSVSSEEEEDALSEETWIDWHISELGNEFLCEVDKRFVEDNFNLYGLRELIPNFKTCLDIILDRAEMDEDYGEQIEKETQDLYGLIHARFILTKKGQERMYRKFKNADFGICPLLGCEGHPMLPIGLDDSFEVNDEAPLPVHVYCSRCQQVMLPARNCIDHNSGDALNGAFFGTTFPHLFLMQFPSLIPRPPLRMDPYVPKVFGFKVRLTTLEENSSSASSSNTILGIGATEGVTKEETSEQKGEEERVADSVAAPATEAPTLPRQQQQQQQQQRANEIGDVMSHDE